MLGCGSEYGVSVAFDDASLAAQSVRFQVAVVTSCITIEPGERPVAPLQIVEFSVDESARALGALEPGDYGLYARAIDENCGVVAAGCQPITVEAGGEGNLRVVLSAAGGDLCGASSACVNGRCESGADGGVDGSDGGSDSGPEPDAGPTCLEGQLLCEGACVQSDEMNCGGCGNVCDFPNGASACEDDECTLTLCDDDFSDCDRDIENGCESSLQAPSTCGDCDTLCESAAPICSTLTDVNECVSDCGSATQCGESCVDVQSNALHCGACNALCDLANAVSVCAGATCTIGGCDEGLDDCDSVAENGCEVDIRSDEANCGGCAIACDAGQECRGGACTGYVGVGVGPSHGCGIQADNSLWCWGRNDHGQSNLNEVGTSLEVPTQFFQRAGLPWSVQQIALGARHTCGINAMGRLECSGDNGLGQRGNRSSRTEVISVISADGTFSRRSFEKIAAGANHTCALDSIGGAWCWGDDEYAQRGTISGSIGANAIPFGARIAIDVATSDNASCFLLDDARVHCIGRNNQGQLGRRTLSEREATPSTVRLSSGATLSGVQTLVAGAESFCAIVTDGRMYCWGRNDDSEIDPTTDGPVTGATQVTASAAGAFLFDGTVCWRTSVGAGEVSCRGRRRDGQFAGIPNALPSSLDTRLPTLDPIQDVVASHSAACGFSAGVLTCWGASYEGAIPRPSLNVERPTTLLSNGASATAWSNITLSSNGGCGLDSDGKPRCWGDGRFGALGNNTQQTAAQPTAIEGSGPREVFRGEFGTGVLFVGEAIDWTGTERTEGLFGGTLLLPMRTELPAPSGFSAVYRHGCAISAIDGRPDNSVICWGENDLGQTGHSGTEPGVVFNGGGSLEVFTAAVIRTGEDFTCALDGSGKAKCWGNNRFGQLGRTTGSSSTMTPGDVDGVPARMELLAVGRRHACAASSRNGVYCWGANESGQMGTGDISTSSPPTLIGDLESPTSISAGANFTCAVNEGALVCWGGSERFQIGNRSTETQPLPTPVNLERVEEVVSAPMGYGSCARERNEWFCWGANDYSGLSVGAAGIFNAPTNIPF